MKKLLFCLLAITGILLTGCSKEDEKTKNPSDFQLTEQEYREKVIEMNEIFDKYGAYDDGTISYDYYKSEHRHAIEKLDLKELENFFIELHSPEGLKNVEDEFTIEKVDTSESKKSTKSTTQYQVKGNHSNSIIGKSSSFVDFTIRDYEAIAFVNAGATYENDNVSYDRTNGNNIVPFYPDANQDYFEHKGGINVSCRILAFGRPITAEMQARFNRNGSGSVVSFRA